MTLNDDTSADLVRRGAILHDPDDFEGDYVIVTDVILTADGPGVQVWSQRDGHWWIDTDELFGGGWKIVGAE